MLIQGMFSHILRQRLSYFLSMIFLWAHSSIAYAEDPLIAAYSVEPQIQAAAFSPSGNTLALALANDTRHFVKILSLDDLKLTDNVTVYIDFTRSSRQEILWIGWANEDTLLANVRSIDSGIKDKIVGSNRLVSISDDGKDLEDLGRLLGVSLRGDAEQFNGSGILSLLPAEPDQILMGIPGHSATKLNIKTGHATLERRGSSKAQYFTPDLRGEVRVVQGARFNRKAYHLKIRDADEIKWRDYKYYPGLKADERVVGFTKNPNEMIIARYGDYGTMEFQVYDLAQKRITKTLFSDPKYDASSLVYNGRLDNIIGVQYIAESPQTRFFESMDISGFNKLKELFPQSNISILANDSLEEKFIVRVSSSSKPGTVYLVSTATGQQSILAYDYPSLNENAQGAVKTVQYPAQDGQVIPGYLTLPEKSAKELPFIVMPHGGPSSRDYAEFDWLAQYLSAKGYGVLQMNFRGSKGFGEEFLEQGRNDWSLMRSDVDDGTKWLISEGLANPEKICILGWSFGGYLAQIAASDSYADYACSASINGVSNWHKLTTGENDEIWGSPENYKVEIKNSPRSKAADVKIPIFLGHAELDTVVPVRQSKRYASILKKKKKEHVFVSYPGADHGIEDKTNRSQLLHDLTEFFEKHIGQNQNASE